MHNHSTEFGERSLDASLEPETIPAVQVLFVRNWENGADKPLDVLMLRRSKGNLKGNWIFPTGICEPGQDLKNAAQSILKRGTGVTVPLSDIEEVKGEYSSSLRYRMSQGIRKPYQFKFKVFLVKVRDAVALNASRQTHDNIRYFTPSDALKTHDAAVNASLQAGEGNPSDMVDVLTPEARKIMEQLKKPRSRSLNNGSQTNGPDA